MVCSRPRHVVVLLPSLDAVKAREAARERKGYWAWSVEELHEGFARSTPRIGTWIDSSHLTPEETVAEVLAQTGAY